MDWWSTSVYLVCLPSSRCLSSPLEAFPFFLSSRYASDVSSFNKSSVCISRKPPPPPRALLHLSLWLVEHMDSIVASLRVLYKYVCGGAFRVLKPFLCYTPKAITFLCPLRMNASISTPNHRCWFNDHHGMLMVIIFHLFLHNLDSEIFGDWRKKKRDRFWLAFKAVKVEKTWFLSFLSGGNPQTQRSSCLITERLAGPGNQTHNSQPFWRRC